MELLIPMVSAVRQRPRPERSPRHRIGALVLLTLLLAGTSLGCLGSRSSAADYDAVYARGLSSCAEQCRPFGVLHFGVGVGPGGSLVYECECMPATTPGEEEEPEEEEGDEEPAEELTTPEVDPL